MTEFGLFKFSHNVIGNNVKLKEIVNTSKYNLD